MDFVRTPEERFEKLPGFPCEPHYVEVAHPRSGTLRMHYVDEGPRDGPVVLMLHGEPTWSYLYRKLVPVFSAAGLRSVAPDHIGFGRSDKLVEKTDYSFPRHLTWLRELVQALDLRDVTLICQDWGGPLGLGVVAAEPERFSRIVAANTILHSVEPAFAGRLAWSNHAVNEDDVQVSTALLAWMALSQRLPDMTASMSVSGATASDLPAAVLAAYDAPFPDETHKAGMRAFPILIPVTPGDEGAAINRNTWKALSSFEKPFLTAFSDSDPATRGFEGLFQERVPGAKGQPHTTVRGAGHFLQEDAGEELARIVLDFVERTSR
jgi:haloalkane dehalogenase